ncbi:hypothetical protein NKF26_11995 [Haladaptatus sp. AB618]|uniref:hypothetical protein n=1 Tax=Haladaptatus sp. AB618 TaxID=2934173 RepID=UPI00209BDB97|nr:hypothetical protein [Haladaptatus sp. AB618]MCO8254524.1 hypothetical protein [Haladaptatus sp. AB618]
MTVDTIRNQLLETGLHEESVDRMLDHYEDMQFHLGNGSYVEAGAHIGNFCENLANVIRAETDVGIDPHISVGNFIDNITNGNYDTNSLEREIWLLIPRAMRPAYALRNQRDSVHVNLEIPVNHSDTQTAVRLCTWMLAEMVRVYGNEDDVDEIATMIDQLASPNTPYIDSYNGKRLIMTRELDPTEEILVHLQALGSEIDADTLSGWIMNADAHSVKSRLGNLKQSRKVHYEDGVAKITPLGVEEAREIIEEHFDSDIDDLSRRDEQLAE